MGGIIQDLRLNAGDLFDGLSKENEGNVDRKIEVKRNPRLEEMVRGFEKVLCGRLIETKEARDCAYNNAPYESSKNDIESFLVYLEGSEEYKKIQIFAGLYLSALIDKSYENEIQLNMGICSKKIDSICYNNFKNISIKGDVGKFAGNEMYSGNLNIFGNANNMLGIHLHYGTINLHGNGETSVGFLMDGGTINIYGNVCESLGKSIWGGEINLNGNAGDLVGCYNDGGKIIINGNAGRQIGDEMTKGEIYLNGKYGNISRRIKGGNIFHKGRQIIKDGKPVPSRKIKWED